MRLYTATDSFNVKTTDPKSACLQPLRDRISEFALLQYKHLLLNREGPVYTAWRCGLPRALGRSPGAPRRLPAAALRRPAVGTAQGALPRHRLVGARLGPRGAAGTSAAEPSPGSGRGAGGITRGGWDALSKTWFGVKSGIGIWPVLPCYRPFPLKKDPSLKIARGKLCILFEKDPRVTSCYVMTSVLYSAPRVRKALCKHRFSSILHHGYTQQPRAADPVPSWSSPNSPCTDSLGSGTPLFPHTRSLTAEFSLSSTNIGLEEHLTCDDTSSLEFVFPGCFGISG